MKVQSNLKSNKLLLSLTICVLVATITACAGAPSHHGSALQSEIKQSLQSQFNSWRGTPYQLGGHSRRGIDCSAFVQTSFRDLFKVSLPRATEQQADIGRRIRRSQLRAGDLVFFKTGWFKRHVGIYSGAGQFIHASTSKGVTSSKLDSPYWNKHFWQARRVMRIR